MIQITEKNKIILQLVADGYTTKEIADKTWLCNRTVENKIQKLTKAFNCKNKTHLANYFIYAGST